MEKKETTASEVSQMEERRERGGWMEGGRERGREGQKSTHVGKLTFASLSVDSEERRYIVETLNSLTLVSNFYFVTYSCSLWHLLHIHLSVCLFICSSVCLTK